MHKHKRAETVQTAAGAGWKKRLCMPAGIAAAVLAACFLLLLWPGRVQAEEKSDAWIQDDAELFTEDEQTAMLQEMQKITPFSPIVIYTTTQDAEGDEEQCARDFFDENLGKGANGTVILIDMDLRKICIWSDGEALSVISESYATTITDNAYTLASDGDYEGCVMQMLTQIEAVWNGQDIAMPMKHICNALLALLLALLLNIFIMLHASAASKTTDKKLLDSVAHACEFADIRTTQTGTSKRHVDNSDDGSFAGSGGDGGSGGGGSHGF